MHQVVGVLVAAIMASACGGKQFVPLEVGQCLADGAPVEGRRAQRVPTVDCRQQHRYQVFAIVTLQPPTRDWPGDETITLNAEQLCAEAIKGATGLEPQDTPDDVDLVHIDPTEDSWKVGDRDVECLFRWDNPTTRTLVVPQTT